MEFISHLSINRPTIVICNKKNFKIIGSAHNLIEARIKKNKAVRKFFYLQFLKMISQRIFRLKKFNLIKLNTKSDFIALGGINQKNLKKLKSLKLKGFASINLGKKKRPKRS